MCTNPIITTKDLWGNVEPLKWTQKARNRIHISKAIGKQTEIKKTTITSFDIVELPCGKCRECRIQKLMEMKTRLKRELQKNQNAFFLTLTYDEKHKKELNKEDIQKFLKRYRKKEKLRYFYVGELGETTERPHYHMIIFGNLPEDLKEAPRPTKKGYKQYTSKQVQTIWKNGLISISKMELPLIGYILKYMTKNSNKKNFICGWSRKPPIGIDENDIEKRIEKINCTRAERQFYKNHYGITTKNQNLVEQHEIKIQEIEKQCKMPYEQYIKQKRQN